MGRRDLVAAAVGAVAVTVAAAGIAYAAGGIPGSDGTIQGCYDSGGNLKVVAALPCPKGFTSLPWGQQGPAGKDGKNGVDGKDGKDGTNGVSPTVAQLSSGDSHCPAGGAAITDAAGSTAYVCSGQNGQDGQSFTGTYTSPNGLFSLQIADDGVNVTGPDARIQLSNGSVFIYGTGNPANGGGIGLLASLIGTQAGGEFSRFTGDRTVRVQGNESIIVTHDRETSVGHNETIQIGNNRDEQVGADETLTVGGSLAATVGGGLDLQGTGALNLEGGTVQVNGSTSCAPAARKGDQVNASSVVSTGSASVCIGG